MRRLADLVVRWPWVVIGAWVALAIALPLTFPSLTEMAEKHPLAILPADAPSSVTAKKMTEAFHESSNDDLLLVVFINENGLGKDDADSYRKVVDALRHDLTNVVSVQDFIGTPELRKFLTSQDNKTWVLPVGLAGELGTPKAFESYNRVTSLIQHSIDGSPTTVHITGPAATVADLTVAGQQDRLPIEIAIAVLVLAVLLLVYRSALTMMLPLVTIGSSLVIAQSVVAAYSQLTGAGVSNQSIVFLSAILAGAGTDYAVFLISRYHDYLRSGKNYDQAVRAAMMSIGKVITASATTVGITFLLLSFAKMGVFQTVGVSSAIGIGVAYLSGMTLLPAILVLAGPRGWVKPRRELTAQFWRRSGIRIVRRPIPHLVASVLVLALLGSCALLARYNYDDRKAVSPSARARWATPRWNATSRSANPSPSTSSFSHHATCALRRLSPTWSRWLLASRSYRTSAWSVVSPAPSARCRPSSGPPIRPDSWAPGWRTAPTRSTSAAATSTGSPQAPTPWPAALPICVISSTRSPPVCRACSKRRTR